MQTRAVPQFRKINAVQKAHIETGKKCIQTADNQMEISRRLEAKESYGSNCQTARTHNKIASPSAYEINTKNTIMTHENIQI